MAMSVMAWTKPRINVGMTWELMGVEKQLKRFIPLILVIVFFVFIHEGTHAVVAALFDEYKRFNIHAFGFEVVFKTPVPEREGIKWFFISGSSNVITLAIGYVLFFNRDKISRINNPFLNELGYWLIFAFMIFDAVNLSIIPFIFGGDIGGIAAGLGINRYIIQITFLVILLINRELIIHNLFPLYKVKTKHPLFRPLLKK